MCVMKNSVTEILKNRGYSIYSIADAHASAIKFPQQYLFLNSAERAQKIADVYQKYLDKSHKI